MGLFNNIREKVAQYVNIRVDLAKLAFIERTSVILSYLIFVFVCLTIGLSLFLFMGLGLAEYFSGLIGSRTGGFFLTAGAYLLLFFLVFWLRIRIIHFFAGIFINVMTDDEDEEEEAMPDQKSK